jgi:hypothetical protein
VPPLLIGNLANVHIQRAPIVEQPARSLRWTSRALVAVTWLSAAVFRAYILAHYGGAVAQARTDEWNSVLPHLHDRGTPLANVVIGVHFVAGAVLLLIGPLQLLGRVRARLPGLHRWIGRVYVVAALGAGVGGLVFIARKGTVGGIPMSLGLAGYGLLVTLCAAEAWRHARARRWDAHRAWAIRLFALTVGSWLYRMDYGFWTLFTNGAGHTRSFNGWFDYVMDFFFYVPNLAVAELLIRARTDVASPATRSAASVVLVVAASFLILATYFFTRYVWGPAIVARLA